jgi:hypothetical protein
MLLGGGICVATDMYLAIRGLLFKQQDYFMYVALLIALIVSALIATAGWGVVKLSGIMQSNKNNDAGVKK